MAYNTRHGYAGLETFVLETKEKYYGVGDKLHTTPGFFSGESVFFQYDWELPDGFFTWSETKMCDHLAQYTQ